MLNTVLNIKDRQLLSGILQQRYTQTQNRQYKKKRKTKISKEKCRQKRFELF